MAFSQVVSNCLGNTKSPDYKEVEVHFLHSHLDYFPENLGATSEEQGDRSHQDIKTME